MILGGRGRKATLLPSLSPNYFIYHMKVSKLSFLLYSVVLFLGSKCVNYVDRFLMWAQYLGLHPQGHMHTHLINPEVIFEDASWPLKVLLSPFSY